MLGHFEVATAEDGRCSWIVEEGEPKLHILVYLHPFILATLVLDLIPLEDQHALLEFLGIDIELLLKPANLQTAFEKHTAIVEAMEQACLVPGLQGLHGIFIGKTQYYRSWQPLFQRAVKHLDMLAWLKLDKDRKDDEEVWGVEQEVYGFEDLKKWLDKKESSKVTKEKTASPKGKKKDKWSDRDQPAEKKKSKKKAKKDDSESEVKVSSWIIPLVNGLLDHLGKRQTSTLFFDQEFNDAVDTKKDKTRIIAEKLDNIAEGLSLLQPVSHKKIRPVLIICSTSFVCRTSSCKPRSLLQATQEWHTVHNNVPVLTGKCNDCNTSYSADHECYYNSSMDHIFTTSAVNVMYNFHASASAYAEFWNNTFETSSVTESVHTIAQESTDVTTGAFSILAADQHSCSECTQPHRTSNNSLINNPAAVAGVDQNAEAVPALNNQLASTQTEALPFSGTQETSDDTKKFVKMVVLDGIVMGPTHCAYPNCTNDLSDARGGSLCDQHQIQLGMQCLWDKFKKFNAQHVQSGVRRMLQPLQKTICAPCGVVIAWTKFARSESTTNILNFLGSVYETEESRPDYVCIDKGCQVLATAVTNGTSDYLCRTYCNPSPANGSAPNLVIVEIDKNGHPYGRRAFNTQVCKQLNAWLGGFQSIAK
ncbi:hypothetical protein CPB84DRAFT_1818953 [Gymnopilus junonius]|uniref:CxC6 like cysteine cluster associated with KDZ domain-containing protein n=1 Tax=Gymnopilus junonius TaxID=109634 RepID=A0A9P5TFC8_GYMJU|nr:hypothetical protein CPB84DRAFT_1818953 [Gymnopilus junonius]